jgi:predicted ATPase
LDRRFKLLTAGRRTAVTRHQTLQGTLDWSHDLLEEPEKVVLRRLSVFAGDFGRSADEMVVADDELDPFDVADAVQAGGEVIGDGAAGLGADPLPVARDHP